MPCPDCGTPSGQPHNGGCKKAPGGGGGCAICLFVLALKVISLLFLFCYIFKNTYEFSCILENVCLY
jgi:hypothetical protein